MCPACIPALTLKLSDTTATWHGALAAREIPCTPFNILKDCTGCDAAQYKETLRALAQNSPLLNTLPQGTGGRTVGLSAVQIQTSLNGEKTEFRLHSTSFTTLIEALRYLDEFCVKVLKYYLDKSKVDALTACFNHTSRLLQANPISPRLTTKESEHPYVSAITGHTKEHLIALFDSQSGAPNHNLGDASDTASTMTKIWTFSTKNYVGPVKSAQDLKGGKGEPRRAVNCYYCKSPVARTPSPGECGGPSSCKWRHHFESLQALLIKTNAQLPLGLGECPTTIALRSKRRFIRRGRKFPTTIALRAIRTVRPAPRVTMVPTLTRVHSFHAAHTVQSEAAPTKAAAKSAAD